MTDDMIEIHSDSTLEAVDPEGQGLFPEEVEKPYAEGKHKPGEVVVETPCEDGYDAYLKHKENCCQIYSSKPFLLCAGNFSLSEIHQQDGYQCPCIILLNGF